MLWCRAHCVRCNDTKNVLRQTTFSPGKLIFYENVYTSIANVRRLDILFQRQQQSFNHKSPHTYAYQEYIMR